MKYISIFILFFPVSVCLSQNGPAINKRFLFNAGIENQIPVNNFKNVYSYGLGISPLVEYKVFKKLSAAINPTYVIYFYSLSSVGVSGSTGFITIKGGPKYYVYKSFYLAAQGGLGIKTSKYGKESSFAYAGSVGVAIYKRFDVQFQYVKIGTSTLGADAIGLRLGYIFK